jgi:hypothetical protein
MANRQPAPLPAPRVVYYTDPVPHRGELLYPTERQLAARREEQHLAYLRWKARQLQFAERDRRVRRFLLGFGAVVGLGVLAGIALAVWLLSHALGGLGLLAIPLVLLAGGGVVVGGHRCVTVIQHWH